MKHTMTSLNGATLAHDSESRDIGATRKPPITVGPLKHLIEFKHHCEQSLHITFKFTSIEMDHSASERKNIFVRRSLVLKEPIPSS
jgi:hypothetical protein